MIYERLHSVHNTNKQKTAYIHNKTLERNTISSTTTQKSRKGETTAKEKKTT